MNNTYNSPSIELVGSVEELTAGNSTGSALDRAFPAGTAFNNLTFS